MEANNFDKITGRLGEYKGIKVIWLQVENANVQCAPMKDMPGAMWSGAAQCWYMRDTPHNRASLHMALQTIGKDALQRVHEVNRMAIAQMEQMLVLKNYSINTRMLYMVEFAQFLYIIKSKPVQRISAAELQRYFVYCHQELGMSAYSIRNRMNALKFYYEQVAVLPGLFATIPVPKRPSTLPKVLSAQQVKALIDGCANAKHKLMMQVCYGLGLRLSEIVNLRIKDIHSSRMLVMVRQAKGKKDRVVALPESLLQSLRTYYLQYKPKDYLFEGQHGGIYSMRSVQLVFKKALAKAHINSDFGIHSLRHSFATHLLEYGTDISIIKQLLGHNSIRTTLIYTHVSRKEISKVKSPLDYI